MDTAEASEVFDGVMLSDGGLIIPSRGVNARLQVKLSGEEHIDWLYHIRDALEALNISVSPGYPRLVAHRPGRQPCVMLSTLCDPYLTEQYRRWYPDGTKEVPEDFRFTPVVLADEFTGDGSARKDKRSPTICLQLCTEGFSLGSIEKIEQELSRLGIADTGRTQQYKRLKGNGSGIRVNVPQGAVNFFMDLVEPHVMPSYRYKIKRR